MWDYFRTLAGVSRIFQDSLGSCGFFKKGSFRILRDHGFFFKGILQDSLESCEIFKDPTGLSRIFQES